LLGKHIEDLLQSSLDHTVLANVKLGLDVFHQTKQEYDRVSVSAYFQFPGVSVVLNNFEFLEEFLKMIDCSVALSLNKLPFEELAGINQRLVSTLQNSVKLSSEPICSQLLAEISIILGFENSVAVCKSNLG
jgi:hypothetical protein